MRLTPWLEKRGRGSREALAREAGVSRVSVLQAEKGLLSNVKVAKAICDATGDAVTLVDLTYGVEAGARYGAPKTKKRLRAHIER